MTTGSINQIAVRKLCATRTFSEHGGAGLPAPTEFERFTEAQRHENSDDRLGLAPDPTSCLLRSEARLGQQQATLLVRRGNSDRDRGSHSHGDSSPSRNQNQLSRPLLGPSAQSGTALAATGPRPRQFQRGNAFPRPSSSRPGFAPRSPVRRDGRRRALPARPLAPVLHEEPWRISCVSSPIRHFTTVR